MIYEYLFEMSIAILLFLIYDVSNLLFRFFLYFIHQFSSFFHSILKPKDDKMRLR